MSYTTECIAALDQQMRHAEQYSMMLEILDALGGEPTTEMTTECFAAQDPQMRDAIIYQTLEDIRDASGGGGGGGGDYLEAASAPATKSDLTEFGGIAPTDNYIFLDDNYTYVIKAGWTEWKRSPHGSW